MPDHIAGVGDAIILCGKDASKHCVYSLPNFA